MPTVLLVSPYLPPHIGGVERYVETVARELVALDWRVVIASPAKHHQGTGTLNDSPIKVCYLDALGRLSNTPVGLHWRTTLKQIIEEEGIDVVNAHAPVPGLADAAERAAGTVPFVLTYHAGPMRKKQLAVNLGLRAYETTVVRHTLRRASFLVCSSNYVRDFLDTFGHSTPVEVIPPGVDVRRFSFMSYEGRRRLLFVGSLERSTRYKALDVLIDALSLMSSRETEIGLDVVGDGNARVEYEELCVARGVADRVTFHGAAESSELSRFYQQATALVLPSRFDSFPTVILEAMSCGTPAVATRVGGIPTIIEHARNGLLVEPGRPQEIASAIGRLTADKSFAASLGVAGRRTVEEKLTAEIQGRRTAGVLEHAIEQCGPRGRRRPTGHPRSLDKRRLVMISPYFPPHIGGVEQFTRHLAVALVATGRWDVTVITTKRHGLRTTESQEDGLHVVRIGCWGRYSYTPFSPLWPWQVRRYIDRVNPDVVNAHTPVPLLSDVAAWASRSRLFLLTYHAATLEKESGKVFRLVERAYGLLERFTVRRADAVLAVSDFVGDALRERVKGRLITFTNAVPARTLLDSPPVAVDGQFVFLARLDKEHRWKGLEHVLAATALCPNARLKVAGDGDLREFYERRAAELGIAERVEFLGTTVGAAKDVLISSSAALIAYPTTSNDAFPTVLLEAGAAWVPCIVSDIGALRTLVSHGIDGWCVPPSEPRALVDAMQYVIDHPQLAAQAGDRARAKMECMTWESQAEQFESLVDSFSPRRPVHVRG